MKTNANIWWLVALFTIILTTGLSYSVYLRRAAEDPPPPPTSQQCDVCEGYDSKRETIKGRFRALKETRNSLDLQAEKQGLNLSDNANIETLVYWDKKRELSYEELAIQRERLDLIELRHHHAMIDHFWKK